jgi:TnpA family transposase
MPHRELLTESQRLSLQAPASDERGMVRHYTLSTEDLALINRRRGDPNRLGFALMLCYLRFPGRILQQGEQPPAARQDYRTARRGRSMDESGRSILASAHPGAAQKSAGSPHCDFSRWH